MHYPPSQITPLCSFRFARFSSSHLFGRSLWGQSVAIYISRSLLKWVTGCQELIPVDQERRPACSWLDTLIACWRRASPRLLINNHPSPSSFTLLKKKTFTCLVTFLNLLAVLFYSFRVPDQSPPRRRQSEVGCINLWLAYYGRPSLKQN